MFFPLHIILSQFCQTPLQLANPTQLQLVWVGVDFVFPRKNNKNKKNNPHLASTTRNDPTCLKFGGCLKCVWILLEVSFEGVGRLSGWCTEGVCMIARGCLDGIWRVYMASFKVLWRLTLTNVKFFEFLKSPYTKSKSFSTKTKVVPENLDL